MGMVGGGRGAFIGGVHRRAAALDGEIELVAGAFSSNPKKSALSGKDFYLKPSRVYASYQEMAEKEKALPENERIDFVTIVVQNYLHFDVAKTFLEAGFNVICDKPVTLDLEQARELRKIINKSKKSMEKPTFFVGSFSRNLAVFLLTQIQYVLIDLMSIF